MGVRKDTLQITITVDAAKAQQDFKRAKDDLTGITNELKLTNQNSKRYKEILGEMAEAQKRFVENASYNQLNNEIRKITRELKKTKEGTAQFELLKKQIIPLQARFQELGGGLSRYNRGLTTTPTLMGRISGAATAMGAKIKAALIGTGVGALVVAIGAVIGKFKELGGVTSEIDKLSSSVARLTGATGSELQKVTSNILATSRTFQEDTEEILDALNTQNNEFGGGLIKNSELIQKGLKADVRGELLNNIKEYSSQFATAGTSAEQFIALAIKAQQAGTFGDKVIDSVKEFTLSIKEQTKPTTDALNKALGKDFTTDLFKRINDGSLVPINALKEIVKEVNKQKLPVNELQTIYADVFKGAGEDVGKFILTLDDLPDSLDELIDKTSLSNRILEEQLRLDNELAESQTKLASRFEGTGAVLSNIGTFLQTKFTNGLVKVVDLIQTSQVKLAQFFAFNLDKFNTFIKLANRFTGFEIPTFDNTAENAQNFADNFETEINRRRAIATEEEIIETEKNNRINELVSKRAELTITERKELVKSLQEKKDLSTREAIILNELQQARVKSVQRAAELNKQQIQANKELEKSIEALAKAAEKEIELAIKADADSAKFIIDSILDFENKLKDLQETVAIELKTEIEFEEEEGTDFDVYIEKLKEDLERKAKNTSAFEANVEALITFSLDTIVDTSDLAQAQKELFDLEFESEQDRQEALLKLETDYASRRRDNAIAILEEKLESLKVTEEGYEENKAATEQAIFELKKEQSKEIVEQEIETAEKRKLIQQNVVSSLQSVTSTFSSFFEIQKQRELKAAGNNAKKREEIEKKFAKKRQGIQLAEAIINTAVAVSGALQMQPFLPVGLLASIAAGAAGAVQIATIKAQQFATGGFTVVDDAGRPVSSKMDMSQGGWADKPSYGIVGEAGTEWVANNKTVNDPVTGPIVKWLHERQTGGRAGTDDLPTSSKTSLIDQAREYKTLVTTMSQGLARVEREITHYVEVVKPAMIQATANGVAPQKPTKETIVKEYHHTERMVVVDEITALQKEREQKAKRARIQ